MKIMAFVGSPRKGSNTDILIGKFIEGARSKADVEVGKYISMMQTSNTVQAAVPALKKQSSVTKT